MTFYFNGTQANVVISGTLGINLPTALQTIISASNTCNGAAQTVYTPAAGKTFYLYGVQAAGNAGAGLVMHRDGTTGMSQLIVCASGTAQGGVESSRMSAVPMDYYDNTHPLKMTGENNLIIAYYGIEI